MALPALCQPFGFNACTGRSGIKLRSDLAIEVVEDSGARTLFRGSVLPQLARGVIADGEHPFIEIVLTSNQARALRLRQLGTTRTFFWSIHELQLLESP